MPTLAAAMQRTMAAAGLALGLMACSGPSEPATPAPAAAAAPTVDPSATARKALAEFEATGSDLAVIASALHTAEPQLHEKLVQIMSGPARPASPVDAMKVIRPLYLDAVVRKMPFASDADVNELVDILIASHKALIDSAPLLCAKGEKSDPDQAANFLPAGLETRENLMRARVLLVTDQSAKRATQVEIEEWKAASFKSTEPRLQGNQYFDLDDPTPAQARKICDAELFILEAIAKEKPDRRAYIYRGLMSPR